MRAIVLSLVACGLAATAEAFELPPVSLDSFRTETPNVGFDVPERLSARDVTTDAFRAEHPDQRLVEVAVPVSLLLYHGEADRVDDIVIELAARGEGMRVHDYTPRTTLLTEHAQPIETTRRSDVDKSIAATLGGSLGPDIALLPSVTTGVGKNDSVTETESRLSPKHAVIVSGTIGGRTGVYFKLRRSTQSTLEGERVFRVTFAAPADWSAGEIEARCVARGEQKWLFVDQRRVWNETARPVDIRLVSHTVAKPAMEE